ncbi:fasciclin domain-containing protein [Tenacibaculum sp. MEBiC06402]|uniref:fasciclin domain-containing protein n=1 Tax=unclassified Tenacibaculum TaxID=2635139 RepID=UPI003B9D9FAF
MEFKNLALLLLISFSSVSIYSNNLSTDPVNDKKKEKTEETIVGVAASNENFSTLVAAVKAANLVDVLNGNGPFTVFAPTNDAFSKLPEGTVYSLLKPENKKLLTAVLTYHVVAGKFDAKAVVKAIKANNGKFVIKTVQGNSLTAMMKGGDVLLKDAKGNISRVIITDVEASNGIIHAIDTVVMPE